MQQIFMIGIDIPSQFQHFPSDSLHLIFWSTSNTLQLLAFFYLLFYRFISDSVLTIRSNAGASHTILSLGIE